MALLSCSQARRPSKPVEAQQIRRRNWRHRIQLLHCRSCVQDPRRERAGGRVGKQAASGTQREERGPLKRTKGRPVQLHHPCRPVALVLGLLFSAGWACAVWLLGAILAGSSALPTSLFHAGIPQTQHQARIENVDRRHPVPLPSLPQVNHRPTLHQRTTPPHTTGLTHHASTHKRSCGAGPSSRLAMHRVSALIPSWDRSRQGNPPAALTVPLPSSPISPTSTGNSPSSPAPPPKTPGALDKVWGFGWATNRTSNAGTTGTSATPAPLAPTRYGRETYWPTTLDKECDKAARIIKSFCCTSCGPESPEVTGADRDSRRLPLAGTPRRRTKHIRAAVGSTKIHHKKDPPTDNTECRRPRCLLVHALRPVDVGLGRRRPDHGPKG